jgi:hypothetical protein
MRHLIQDKLTSGVNIKSINGQSILGGGNISIGSGGVAYTVTTTDATLTTLYNFTPDSDGVYNIEWMITGFEVATGNAIGSKTFATFKVIAGVVTQVSTQTNDRKSNFANVVNVTLDSDGTQIRCRVVGQGTRVIDWIGYLTVNK